MGVKGLQGFLDHSCPGVCVTVDLRKMASQHVASHCPTVEGPTLVVDGMACLRHWYTCENWVCGGQWREYMDVLKRWVGTFNSAGITLVFFFDGVVEEKKRNEWVKRRHRVNGQISKIFRHIKAHGDQPGRELFCLPSGLATFTSFALRSLGQKVFCSVQEADYEIARYARQHNCMGILGQDSDFIIYDSSPYMSVEKLQMNSLTTVLYDRQKFCQTVGLSVRQLPLLACLLGNDVVSEEQVRHIRNNAVETYRKSFCAPHHGAVKGEAVLAVSQLVSSFWGGQEEDCGHILQSLDLSDPQREILERGISSYLLPTQDTHRQGDIAAHSSTPHLEKYVSQEILKACREKHVASEGFMVYCVLCVGVTECSNTLEDEEDTELLPQALVFKRCRQNIYGLLLAQDGNDVDLPVIKEWFVFPGNRLKEPDLVHPVPLSLPTFVGGRPRLEALWFGSGSDVSTLRLKSFLMILDCQDFAELYGMIEDCLLAALCLVTYIVLQVQTVSQEDVDAYLSQIVCLNVKSAGELQHIHLPVLSSRAVQLGSLYVRGLSHLLGANCASGNPFPNSALMPWHSFDGRLFQFKYLLAHGGTETTELLEGDSSCLSTFHLLRDKLKETCRKRGRVLESKPRPHTPGQNDKTGSGSRSWDRHTDDHGSWRSRGEMAGGSQCGRGWRREEKREERGETRGHDSRERQWDRGGYRGGGSHHDHHTEGPKQPHTFRGRRFGSRGRYQMAPRWSQPPSHGT